MPDILPSNTLLGPAQQAASQNVDIYGDVADPVSDRNPVSPDAFWEVAEIDTLRTRWDESFPYQFLFLERINGKWQQSSGGEIFTLPIPPQSLVLSMPFATNLSVTNGGVIAEYNGIPLRPIVLQGTTGVLPLRPTTGKASQLSAVQGIFTGTTTAVTNLVNSVQAVSNISLLPGIQPDNVLSDSDFEGVGGSLGRSTGFYQWQLLQRFLEGYATLKKTSAGRNIALGFAIWKEQSVYVVEPMNVDVTRNAKNPLRYDFTIQLKAWRRISLTGSTPEAYKPQLAGRDPNKYAQILNTISGARRILESARNVLSAVRADIDNVLYTPLRESVLFLKDGIGFSAAVTDLPQNIWTDIREPVAEKVGLAGGNPNGGIFDDFSSKVDPVVQQKVQAIKNLAISTNKGGIGGATLDQDLTWHALKRGKNASPANKFFTNPSEHFDLFDKIDISQLNLRPVTIKAIEDERRRVRRLRRKDFEDRRDAILQALADFTDYVGQGDPTYAKIFGQTIKTPQKVATDADWDVIYSMSQAAQALDAMACSATIDRDHIEAIDYIAGLANRSGIAFKVPNSKFLVPFPYGVTLEKLSLRYLKTADRWHEIAALNGLQAPYVDEEGFTQLLLANGNANMITVASSSNYYVNQQVWLSSQAQRLDKRRISSIHRLAPTISLLTLTGDSDLAKFTTAAKAQIQAFLPNTVNSQQYIYIPSDDKAPDDFKTKEIPGVDYFDPLVRVGGIGLLIDQTGDLVITQDGVTRLAVGLSNIIQRVKIACNTVRGTLLHHPEFGIGIKFGTSTADISANDLLHQIRGMFRGDPAISGVNFASVSKFSNSIQTTIGVSIKGVKGTVPITTEILK